MQKTICDRFNAPFVESPLTLKVGIALNIRDGILPINGLRHPPEGDTTGWYIWAGEEMSEDPDFFVPLHIEHLCEWCPRVLPYLGLAPGWHFLVAGDYEDVWEDESLLL
ncbi:MAG: immunity protein Imm33 domain-containing protein [Armatimonadota bacterium]